MKIKNLSQVMHYFANEFVQPNSIIIDATAGNGNDTYFLASTFANNVISVDINPLAISNTKLRCKQFSNISYYCLNHTNIYQVINKPISFAVFNLGYLPHSNDSTTTLAQYTIKCLTTILNNLLPGGGIVISIYTKHDNHREEKSLQPFLKQLDQHKFLVLQYQMINLNEAPYLIIIEKKG